MTAAAHEAISKIVALTETPHWSQDHTSRRDKIRTLAKQVETELVRAAAVKAEPPKPTGYFVDVTVRVSLTAHGEAAAVEQAEHIVDEEMKHGNHGYSIEAVTVHCVTDE